MLFKHLSLVWVQRWFVMITSVISPSAALTRRLCVSARCRWLCGCSLSPAGLVTALDAAFGRVWISATCTVSGKSWLTCLLFLCFPFLNFILFWNVSFANTFSKKLTTTWTFTTKNTSAKNILTISLIKQKKDSFQILIFEKINSDLKQIYLYFTFY